jgi:hypothetical protein
MITALKSMSVAAVLLAVGLGVAYVSPTRIDPEAIEAAAARPLRRRPGETRGFRFPAPDAYPLRGRPWIKSREDLIDHYAQGEDPELVRRYREGPEEELIEYLAELFRRRGEPATLTPSARAALAAMLGRSPIPPA